MDHESDKIDGGMLPGFRFHPTDEELVGFYLKRKIQQRPLSIQLIKQLDIYKYDPWDLQKVAAIGGEKEWYFFCPRDRKYRNSARPNRVTSSGFWKATGTDRPIYNSQASKCIGLKKSLVFYKGRAAKGIKTDWMMHEFRLPSIIHSSHSPKPYTHANDAWAICRIFKKTNSASQTTISQSFVSPITETTTSNNMKTQSTSDFTMSHPNKTISTIQFCTTMNSEKPTLASLTPVHAPCFKAFNQISSEPSQFSTTSSNDASSILQAMSSSIFGDCSKASQDVDFNIGGPKICSETLCSQDKLYHTPLWLKSYTGNLDTPQNGHDSNFLISIPEEIQEHIGHGEDTSLVTDPSVVNLEEQWGNITAVGCPNLMNLPDAWKSTLLWDSSPGLTDISTHYSINDCYT